MSVLYSFSSFKATAQFITIKYINLCLEPLEFHGLETGELSTPLTQNESLMDQLNLFRADK